MKIKITILLLIIISSCSKTNQEDKNSIINLAHLNTLYEEININNVDMGIIHIYSEYPDYNWVSVEEEGAACIDDVARAVIVYLEHNNMTGKKSSLEKVKKLVNFILYMQTDGGYFYNFIRDDHSINEDFKTSIPGANWWTWRALWTLSEAHKFFENKEPEFADKIYQTFEKGIVKSISDFSFNKSSEKFGGFETPLWLPGESGSDQAALFSISLLYYFNQSENQMAMTVIENLSKGIMMMQINDSNSEQYGAIRSWRNIWHAWGNIQSYSLLQVYKITKDEALLNSALLEINNFYKDLINKNYLNEFEVENDKGNVSLISKKQFAQIAYGIRPMVYACLTAFEITNDSTYAKFAGEIGAWLFGNNPANKIMYDKNTGRCFDGIISAEEINYNSGAESTIEALLTLIEIDKYDLARNTLLNFKLKE